VLFDRTEYGVSPHGETGADERPRFLAFDDGTRRHQGQPMRRLQLLQAEELRDEISVGQIGAVRYVQTRLQPVVDYVSRAVHARRRVLIFEKFRAMGALGTPCAQ